MRTKLISVFLSKKSYWILLITFAWTGRMHAQSGDSAVNVTDPFREIVKLEDSMIIYADSLRFGVIMEEKARLNEKFVRALRKALDYPNSYEYPFERLKEYIRIIVPEDNSFRIFNWVVLINEFSRRYYGAIQMNSPELKLYPLLDYSEELESNGRALDKLTHKEWYGGEIYNIYKLPNVLENGLPVYAVFSYNNNAVYSKKKIFDHMVVTEQGPVFGLPIIVTPEATINRLIVEYKKEAFVNLNFNKDEQKVIFDRVSSEIGDPTKRFTYVPTGHMDGFQLKEGKWRFVPDAIPIMKLQDGQAPIDGVFPNR
ncbi:MAG: hypothetical protein KL787_06945 [Taibaiella sp.]|nr:hypothetical protein [Taibaiella sp.]